MSETNTSDPISPLLAGAERLRRSRPSLGFASRFVRRRGISGTAAERRRSWTYSPPVVFLDTLWNIAFVVVAAGVLATSRRESPPVPLRVWIVGYAVQCVLHVLCVLIGYKKRRNEGDEDLDQGNGFRFSGDLEEGRSFDYSAEENPIEEETSFAKNLESANTMFSFIWWIIGFYWVSVGGQALTQDAPQLYWLCIVFLAFDVFFIVFCIALAFIIGVAVCCCLPCIIAILYAAADQQEGASDRDIHQLPKYNFRRLGGSTDGSKINGGIITECGTVPSIEHSLSPENTECCICLSQYEDGAELRGLPCGHHFHCVCIDKWLHINATCPLCKYSIIKSNSHATEEV